MSKSVDRAIGISSPFNMGKIGRSSLNEVVSEKFKTSNHDPEAEVGMNWEAQ